MGSGREGFLAQLSCYSNGKVLITFPGCTCGMNHISWVPAEDRIVLTDDGSYGHSFGLCPAQKGADWMDEGCFSKVHVARTIRT